MFIELAQLPTDWVFEVRGVSDIFVAGNCKHSHNWPTDQKEGLGGDEFEVQVFGYLREMNQSSII